jgi:iron complex transport system ATP-binding protein
LGYLRGKGEILWDGKPLASWPRRELARLIAYLPQSPAASAGHTVLDVLRLGRAPYWSAFGVESPHDIEIVKQISELLNLKDFMSRPIDQLSGGQRQTVFLGRCLVQEPRVMLLDEPNTFLDLKHQIDLLKLLRKLSRERQIAIIMASHDLNLAGAFADRLHLLQNGVTAATGAPADVLKPEILSQVYELSIDRIEGNHSTFVFPRIEMP